MYYAHFGLQQPPFKITPNTDFFFSGGNRGAVLEALLYAINSGEGIVKVVGEVGSGKTMLCRMLQSRLPEHVESVFLANPSVAPEAILHAIAFELPLNLPPQADRLLVMQALQQYLLERHAAGRQVVIFVEEAQGMPLATLEEIRLLSNLETRHDKLLQIVLFGQPELDKNLDETQIRQLRERITHSFDLWPLNESEVGEYLIFRLRAGGHLGTSLFTPAAIRLIANASRGLVRRVNILADKSLLAAYSENLKQVTPEQVQAAIKDSEFGKDFSNKRNRHYLYAGLAAMLLVGLVAVYFQYSSKPSGEINPIAKIDPMLPGKALTLPKSSTANTSPTKSVMVEGLKPEPLTKDFFQQRLDFTNIWLHQQNSSTVSIQLFGGANEQQIKQQLAQLATQLESEKIYVYRTKVRGNPFITVLTAALPTVTKLQMPLKNCRINCETTNRSSEPSAEF